MVNLLALTGKHQYVNMCLYYANHLELQIGDEISQFTFIISQKFFICH